MLNKTDDYIIFLEKNNSIKVIANFGEDLCVYREYSSKIINWIQRFG